MDRRQWLTRLGLTAGAASIPLVLSQDRRVLAQDTLQPSAAANNLPPPRITDLKAILTVP